MRYLVLLAFMLPLGGCATLGYYRQAINGQMQVIGRARPFEQVLSDPAADDSLKQQLADARQIREFASRELGLPDNGTFRRYADLHRPFVVWNVFAAPEFSIQPKEWCYPLFGCANYRGYFSQDDAEAAARNLRREGYDTYVKGIPAYSTLGWFDDPLLNTFIRYPRGQLAALIFHELAHQVVYLPNDTTFNESFAATVELEGTRRWLARNGTERQRGAFETFQQRRQAFSALVCKYRARLGEIYASALLAGEKRSRKAAVLRAMREEYEETKSAWGGFAGYDQWFSEELNNAQLASVSLYAQRVPAFQALLAREDSDLPRFYRAVKSLGALSKAERRAALCHLGTRNQMACAGDIDPVDPNQ